MPARVRTESMIDRLGKKPLSEGFALWDKGYAIGALRLLQCKVDAAGTPPFEVAQSLDAVGQIMIDLEDPDEETQETYTKASEKYDMIQKKALAALMGCKLEFIKSGVDAALGKLEEAAKEHSNGRIHAFKAELLHHKGKNDEALAECDSALKADVDRAHIVHKLKGDILAAGDKKAEAQASYEEAIKVCAEFQAAHDALIDLISETDKDKAIALCDAVNGFHPRSDMIVKKAFLVAEKGDEAGAVELIDGWIGKEKFVSESNDDGVSAEEAKEGLILGKAAVLADQGKVDAAMACVDEVLKINDKNERAQAMKTALKEA